MTRFEVGHPVRVEMTKWGGRPHWEWEGLYLGEDEHGEWLGYPIGTHFAKPGRGWDADFASVGLVPHRDAAHLTVFNRRTEIIRAQIYIDMATPPEWHGDVLRSIDLDLDVVRRWDGETAIIDQDEFEQHQVELGYPPEIIAMTEESAGRVYAAVNAEEPPYDDATRERWFTVLADLSG